MCKTSFESSQGSQGVVTKPWNHTKFKIEPLHGKNPLPVLLGGVRRLKGKWWISAGTLLGFIRDGNFLPLDTDLDVSLVGNVDRTPLPGFKLVRTVDSDDGKEQYQTVFLHEETNILFDINQYHPRGENYRTYRELDEYIETPKELVDPLKTMTYKGYDFPIPNDIERYLTMWYGNWRIPEVSGKREWLS